jgi:chemotaxis signal transduction protein
VNPISAAGNLQDLRRAFDESFAVASSPTVAQHQNLLAFAVGEQLLAARLTEIVRLEQLRKQVPVPGARPELLGLGATQDRLYPLFSLAVLLGQVGGEEPRWVMLVAGNEPVGLAFSRFDGLVRVPPGSMSRAANPEGARPLTPELCRVGETVRGLLDVNAVLDQIGRTEGPALRGRK